MARARGRERSTAGAGAVLAWYAARPPLDACGAVVHGGSQAALTSCEDEQADQRRDRSRSDIAQRNSTMAAVNASLRLPATMCPAPATPTKCAWRTKVRKSSTPAGLSRSWALQAGHARPVRCHLRTKKHRTRHPSTSRWCSVHADRLRRRSSGAPTPSHAPRVGLPPCNRRTGGLVAPCVAAQPELLRADELARNGPLGHHVSPSAESL